MNAEHNTSVTLRFSVYIGMVAVIIGLVAFFLDMGDALLWTGLLIVIVSPLAGVVVTTVSLYLERDLRWVLVALVLIAISVVGMIFK